MILTTIELKGPLIYIVKNITSSKEYKQCIFSSIEFNELDKLRLIFKDFLKPTSKLQS
jgi:hypothetical protein